MNIEVGRSQSIQTRVAVGDMETVANHHFVLVHGAGQGAWCWFKIMKQLRSAGHRATALDLVACGVDPTKLEEVNSIHHYCRPLMEFLQALPAGERVVLVGHSYAGLVISLAMESFPHKILVAIFVTAYMPHFVSPPATLVEKLFKSLSTETVLDTQFIFGDDPRVPNTVVYGTNFMSNKLYQYCSEEELELAKLLVRPFKMFLEDLNKESVLTEAKFGSVDRVFIVCEGDEVMESRLQKLMIEEFPPKAVKCINGGGHMVMLSEPTQLLKHLGEVADSLISSPNKCGH